MTRLALVLAVAAGVAAFTAPRAPAQHCLLVIDNVDRNASRRPMLTGDVNVQYDAAGNVRMHCRNQNVHLACDSLSALSGDYVHLYGHVVYRDTTYRVAADSMLYLLRTELIEARGNVRVLDKGSGSTMAGPYVDYWRQAKGVNDSARFVALLRPVVRYFARATPLDTVSQRPYVLTGDHLDGFGESRLYGGGKVSIERDSLHGTGDSLSFERVTGSSIGELAGKPARLFRIGNDSFTVIGHRIRLGLAADRLRDLRAFDSAQVLRGESVITGDTVHMSFERDKLSLTLAWGRTSRATLHSSGYDAAGDSLAVESPAEELHEVRIFGHGTIANPRDSATTAAFASVAAEHDSATTDSMRNTLWGDRLVARFTQVDSAGAMVTRLSRLDAIGKAASYFAQVVRQNGRPVPSVNYTRADTIVVAMKTGDSTGVAAVQARGHVDGIQLETATAKKPRSDSAAATPAGRKP